MRALTLHQPWAWAVSHANKGVENRPRKPPRHLIDHDFAVHAGLTVDIEAWRAFRDGRYGPSAKLVPDIDRLVRGAIVAIAHLDGYTIVQPLSDQPLSEGRDPEADRLWWSGPVGNLLSNRRPLAQPIPCRGMQGWWPVPSAIELAVGAQLAGATVEVIRDPAFGDNVATMVHLTGGRHG